MNKLNAVFEQFDAYNQKDPNTFAWEGINYPQEYFLAIELYNWVNKLDPNASEELLLASRSQHIGRWEIPRNTYPEGREAYLKWRKDLALYHAEKTATIMENVGYDPEQIARVRQIILKQKIKVDHDVQTMENALCLVFLQFQYEDFHPKYEADKVINILKKSLLKMDAHGHQFALKLTYTNQGLHYIKEALKLINSN
ncbi:DUF4202 domain-containing protein [Mucilaginibacter lappiensis]|uniref:DUF4202 domain-containing protein n=1 Tax=Mucilaginibacter lappiensis TaxID=354630 RepID=A0A1N7FSI3_9SPHI|nr:DUF4202 domain-containing protein [Mucilaginibacter lappiensis]MBB6112572.1 hypothetical protein [Mucilaginibacter lappiensis]MBB6129190.1 hypothetical protein [Mucilaginibacter lappiensis]SIS03280.1 protein of unknown function [Mucilaginibacter lappiensis]